MCRIKPQPQQVPDDGDWTEVSAPPPTTIEQQHDASIPSNSHSKDNPDPEEDGIVMVEDEEETQARAAKIIQYLTNDVKRLTLRLGTTERACIKAAHDRNAYGNDIERLQARLKEAYATQNQLKEKVKSFTDHILKLEEGMMEQRRTIKLLETARQTDHVESSTAIQTLTQQFAVLEQHNKNLTGELMGLATHYDLRIRSSHPTENLFAGHVSISIHGKHFAFIGPQTMSVYVPTKAITMSGKNLHERPTVWRCVNNNTRDICEMGWGGVVVFNSQTDVFGENGRVVLKCETEVDSPPSIDGGEAHACLRDVQPACRITHFSLGENQGTRCLSYIPRNDDRSATETPNPTTQQHVSEIVWPDGRKETTSALRRVWFGKDGVWVAENADGTYSWSDQLSGREGSYYGLAVALTNDLVGCKSIMALSMDKVDGRSWVLVFGNGAVAYSEVVGFDKFHFEEWASQNFGCNFGVVEKPASYGAATRYRRVDKVKKEDE